MSIFDRWNNAVDLKGLQEDIAQAEENGGDYREVPVGTYEVKIEKIEMKECTSDKNAGKPMVSIWFRILKGDYQNSMIFFNQLIVEGFQISMMNRFLKSLDVLDEADIEFKDYGQYNQLLLDIFEAVDGELEFLLEYGVNKKGYNTYKILEVYDS